MTAPRVDPATGSLVYSGVDQPEGFRCPVCFEHQDGEVTIRVETITEDRYPQVQLWPGGPLGDDRSRQPERVEVDQILSTGVCEHRFAGSEWAWATHRNERSGRQWMTLEPRSAVAADE